MSSGSIILFKREVQKYNLFKDQNRVSNLKFLRIFIDQGVMIQILGTNLGYEYFKFQGRMDYQKIFSSRANYIFCQDNFLFLGRIA